MEAEMPKNRQTNDQRIISVFSLLGWADSIQIDRKAGGLFKVRNQNDDQIFLRFNLGKQEI